MNKLSHHHTNYSCPRLASQAAEYQVNRVHISCLSVFSMQTLLFTIRCISALIPLLNSDFMTVHFMMAVPMYSNGTTLSISTMFHNFHHFPHIFTCLIGKRSSFLKKRTHPLFIIFKTLLRSSFIFHRLKRCCHHSNICRANKK